MYIRVILYRLYTIQNLTWGLKIMIDQSKEKWVMRYCSWRDTIYFYRSQYHLTSFFCFSNNYVVLKIIYLSLSNLVYDQFHLKDYFFKVLRPHLQKLRSLQVFLSWNIFIHIKTNRSIIYQFLKKHRLNKARIHTFYFSTHAYKEIYACL